MSKHYASWNDAGDWVDFTSNPSERARNVCQRWNNGEWDLPTCWTSCSCRPNHQRRLPSRGWSCPGLEIHHHSMPISPTSLKEMDSFLGMETAVLLMRFAGKTNDAPYSVPSMRALIRAENRIGDRPFSTVARSEAATTTGLRIPHTLLRFCSQTALQV